MRKIYSFIFILTIIFQNCAGQTIPKKEFYNREFNWAITIPENFDTVSSGQWAKMEDIGAEAIEKTIDEKLVDRAKNIFIFKSDQFNYFESNYQPYDSVIDGNYLTSCKRVNEMIYQTFFTQMPDIKIDSLTSSEIIDNLEFQTFKITITFPNFMIMNVIMYSRLFDKKEFSVNIMYVDKTKGDLMLDSWRNSRFGQN